MTQTQILITKASIFITETQRLPDVLMTHVLSWQDEDILIEELVTLHNIFSDFIFIITSLKTLRMVHFV